MNSNSDKAIWQSQVHDPKQVMKEIGRQGKLLTTANEAATILLAAGGDADITTVLMRCLALVGKELKVDRVQIWQNEMMDGSIHFVHKHQWLSDLGKQKPPVPIGLKFPYSSMPGWETKFLRGECINKPLSETSPDVQTLLQPYEIKTILIIPLFLHGLFWGFFSIDDCEREYVFSEDELSILHSISLMMISAIVNYAQATKILEAHERTQLLLNNTPFACYLKNRNMEVIDCNDENLRLFNIDSKQQFIDNFYDFIPEYQPCGCLSSDIMQEAVQKAFNNGRFVLEYTHQRSDCTPIPVEKALVCVPYDDDFVVATYLRDLREHNQMLNDIERRDILMNIMNRVSSILLQTNTKKFEDDLYLCMSILADAVALDRIVIWKNDTRDGKLYCTRIYQYLPVMQDTTDRVNVVNVSYDDAIPGWESALSQGVPITKRVSEMNPQELAQVAAQGVKSLFVVPVLFDEKFWGYVGYDNFHIERVFTDNEQKVLHSAGIAFANAISRNTQAIEIIEAHERAIVLFHKTPFACHLWDDKLNIFNCNDENLKLFDIDNKQDFLDNYLDFIPECQPDGQSTINVVYTAIGEAFKDGKSVVQDCMHQRRDGTLIPTEVTLVRVPFGSDFVVAAYLRDLREQKSLMNDIEQAHKRMKLLLDSMPFACRLLSRDYGVIDYNEASLRLFNLKESHEYVRRYSELSPKYQPDGSLSKDKALFMLNKAFDEGKCSFEWLHQMLDGTPIPTEISLVRVPYENDFIVAGYTSDLREHKKMMAKIEQRNHLLDVLNNLSAILLKSTPLSFANDIYYCMGLLGNAVNVDQISIWKNLFLDNDLNYKQMLEWRFDFELTKDKLYKLEELRQEFEPRRYSEKPSGWEDILRNGQDINCTVRTMPEISREHFDKLNIKTIYITPIFLSGHFWGFVAYNNHHLEHSFSEDEMLIMRSGGMILVSSLLRDEMMIDISNNAEKLEVAYSEAQKANNAKSDFLANMSHEMRTPLNAIIGLSTLVLSNEGLDDENFGNLEKINNAGRTLLGIVNDILDISKIEAGKFDLIHSNYDTASLINDTVTQNILRVGEKPITFFLNVSADLPASLCGDELRVKQILNNLLSNAIKYTREGTVTFSVSHYSDGDSIWLTASVCDTGIGIKKEDLLHLFSAYNQVDTMANRKIEGAGLGLSLTKRLTEMMDGEIAVESEYGKGSIFSVRLRQKFVSDAVIGNVTAENLKSFHYSDQKWHSELIRVRVKLPHARILVVDDIITNLDVAKGLMKLYDMQIDCVTSGQLAIEAINDRMVTYNAIFMDHMMPDMDGIEAAQRIRNLGTDYAKNIPIIALTANAIVGNEQMFLNRGFQAFLSKPIDISRLDEVIRHWVCNSSQTENYSPQEEATVAESMSADVKDEIAVRLRGVKINGLDISRGIKRFGGDENVYLGVLRSFAVSTPPLLEQIKTLNSDKLADYAIIFHGIKGSSRGIFAGHAGDLAEKLERAAKDGDFNFVSNNSRGLIVTIEQLINDIQSIISVLHSENPKPKRDRPDDGVLQKLITACENHEMDGVDAAIEEINCFQYEADGGLAAWLGENAKLMNFKEIIEKLCRPNQ